MKSIAISAALDEINVIIAAILDPENRVLQKGLTLNDVYAASHAVHALRAALVDSGAASNTNRQKRVTRIAPE